MYLHELVIEGFKSYAQRTIIGPFDQSFNAITGLNGSGKSNVLDAICFVLGMTNLSTVRCETIKDLVYKQGHGGVREAYVKLCFANDDLEYCPKGYELCNTITVSRRISIDGKHKFAINDKIATQHAVGEFFQSIKLNVNNPTFLVMQGMITKVINMGPLEIFGMIEEASSTKAFELRKTRAVKLFESADARLDECHQVMDSMINPKLDVIEEEKKAFHKYTELKTEVSALHHYLKAYRFFQLENAVAALEAEEERLDLELATLPSEASFTDGLDQLDREQMAVQDRLSTLNSSDLAPLHTKLKTFRTQLYDNEESTKILDKKLSDAEAERSAYESEKSQLLLDKTRMVEELHALRDKHTALEEHVKSFPFTFEKLEICKRNIHLGDRESGEVYDELTKLQVKRRSALDEISAHTDQIENYENKIRRLTTAMADLEEKTGGANRKKSPAEIQVEEIDEQLRPMRQNMATLVEKCATYDGLHAKWTVEWDQLSAMNEDTNYLWRHDFQYVKHPAINDAEIHGVAWKFLHLKPEYQHLAPAITLELSHRLKHVIVDSTNTANALLDYGDLQERTTFICLDALQPVSLQLDKIEAAKQAYPQAGLVGLHECFEEVSAFKEALSLVLGEGTLLLPSEDCELGDDICIQTGLNVVTLECTKFQPNGITQGGAFEASYSFLWDLTLAKERTKDYPAINARYEAIEAQMQPYKAAYSDKYKLSTELEIMEYKRKKYSESLMLNDNTRLVAELGLKRLDMDRTREEILRLQRLIPQYRTEIAETEALMAPFEQDDRARLNMVDEQIKKAKEDEKATQKELRTTRNAAHEKKDGIDRLELEVENVDWKIREALPTNINERITMNQEEFTLLSSKISEIQSSLEAHTTELSDCHQKLETISQDEKTLKAEQEVTNLARREMTAKSENNKQVILESGKSRKVLVEDEPWLLLELDLGQPHSTFDFSQFESPDFQKDLMEREALHEAKKIRLEDAERTVNRNVMADEGRMASSAIEVQTKIDQIEDDRGKISAFTSDLDYEKKSLIKDTWDRINGYFNGIFRSLLPNAEARLAVVEGSINNGLRIEVGFSGVWKHSLRELSGGQRSLLSLSLILAMLRFKPSPLYILDEVDAALDLSHTQNIGKMIREHFPNSQFLVVSLKEGLFRNARVIFRTRFIDGVSLISRSQNLADYSDQDPVHDDPPPRLEGTER